MKKLNLFLLTLVTFTALTSFSGNDKVFNNADKWIPADFDPRKTTLVVECFFQTNSLAPKADINARKSIAEYMQQKYPYKFEVATEPVQDKGKYADKNIYRYVLTSTNTTYNNYGSNGVTVTAFDFHIYDRKLDKHYPGTGKGASYIIWMFKPMINTIVKFLEEKK